MSVASPTADRRPPTVLDDPDPGNSASMQKHPFGKSTLDYLFGRSYAAEFQAKVATLTAKLLSRIRPIPVTPEEPKIACSKAFSEQVAVLLERFRVKHLDFAVRMKRFVAIKRTERSGPWLIVPAEGVDHSNAENLGKHYLLFPSLGIWLSQAHKKIRSLGDGEQGAIRQARDELAAILERLARFADRAVRRSLDAILASLASLRSLASPGTSLKSASPTLRVLAAVLLSAHVLAAGGGPGLFVTRC